MTGGNGSPVPQGAYVAAKRHGGLIFTSGMTPRRDGVLLFTGPVRASNPLENYREAVELACGNALRAAGGRLEVGERIASILSLTVYLAREPGFAAHSRLADFASRFRETELGRDGSGCRAAVGAATLPGEAPVEIQLIAAVEG